MRILRTRSTRLLAAFVMGALAIILGTPDRVSGNTCGFAAHYTYYAEPEKINAVGTCDRYCGSGGSTCTGTITPYSTRDWYIACPFC